jgi:putative membrane protein
MKINRFLKQFNWRFVLVRIVVNALALAITAAVMPKIRFVDKSIWSLLLMALMLGVLNALLKPILQFLTLQFIFVTYGLVIVAVNSLLLWLLSLIFPNRFAVDNILWLLVGGLVLGLLSSFLESLFGLTMPIVPDEPRCATRSRSKRAKPTGSRPQAVRRYRRHWHRLQSQQPGMPVRRNLPWQNLRRQNPPHPNRMRDHHLRWKSRPSRLTLWSRRLLKQPSR